MEELYVPRLVRHEYDLQPSVAVRALRRRARAERHAAGVDSRAAQQGPYETAYDVALGYCCDRSIDRP